METDSSSTPTAKLRQLRDGLVDPQIVANAPHLGKQGDGRASDLGIMAGSCPELSALVLPFRPAAAS
jgi:hypothetical protein